MHVSNRNPARQLCAEVSSEWSGSGLIIIRKNVIIWNYQCDIILIMWTNYVSNSVVLPGAHFTKAFAMKSQIRWKICFIVLQIVIKWLLHSLGHDTKLHVWCRVCDRYIIICCPGIETQWREICRWVSGSTIAWFIVTRHCLQHPNDWSSTWDRFLNASHMQPSQSSYDEL